MITGLGSPCAGLKPKGLGLSWSFSHYGNSISLRNGISHSNTARLRSLLRKVQFISGWESSRKIKQSIKRCRIPRLTFAATIVRISRRFTLFL